MVLYLTSTYTRFVSVSALHQHHRLLSDAPVYQPSVIELFPDAAARLWNTLPLNVTSAFVNICFQETFDDPSLQSFFPESPVVPVHSDTNRSFYLLTYLLTTGGPLKRVIITCVICVPRRISFFDDKGVCK